MLLAVANRVISCAAVRASRAGCKRRWVVGLNGEVCGLPGRWGCGSDVWGRGFKACCMLEMVWSVVCCIARSDCSLLCVCCKRPIAWVLLWKACLKERAIAPQTRLRLNMRGRSPVHNCAEDASLCKESQCWHACHRG